MSTRIGCILLGKDTEIEEGSRAARTGKMAGIPVGDGYIGRVVNALGEPIDGKGKIETTVTVQLKNRHQALLTVSLSIHRLRQVFCLLTLCSLLDADSVS